MRACLFLPCVGAALTFGRVPVSHSGFSSPVFTDDFRLANVDGSIKVVASHHLDADAAWGPYTGSVQTEEAGKGPEDEVRVRGHRGWQTLVKYQDKTC